MESQSSAQVLLRCSSSCAPPPLVKNRDGTIPISFYATPLDTDPTLYIDVPIQSIKLLQEAAADGKKRILTLLRVDVIGFDELEDCYTVSFVPIGSPEQRSFENKNGCSGVRINRSSLFSYYLASQGSYD